MEKLIASLASGFVFWLCGIWTMTWGWGLEIADFGGLIIPMFVACCVAVLFGVMASGGKK